MQAILEISSIGLFSIQQVPHCRAQQLGLGLCLCGLALEREVLRGPAIFQEKMACLPGHIVKPGGGEVE